MNSTKSMNIKQNFRIVPLILIMKTQFAIYFTPYYIFIALNILHVLFSGIFRTDGHARDIFPADLFSMKTILDLFGFDKQISNVCSDLRRVCSLLIFDGTR